MAVIMGLGFIVFGAFFLGRAKGSKFLPDVDPDQGKWGMQFDEGGGKWRPIALLPIEKKGAFNDPDKEFYFATTYKTWEEHEGALWLILKGKRIELPKLELLMKDLHGKVTAKKTDQPSNEGK